MMNRPAARLLAMALIAGAAPVALPARAADVQIAANGPVVEINVNEEVRAAPDSATFGMGVQTKAPTAIEALRLNSAAMRKLIDRMKALGVAEKDIQTSGISLNAEYDYRNDELPRFTGYRVSNEVRVFVRDIDGLGRLLDAGVEAGATNLNGPVFGIENDTQLKARARETAFRRGEAQAREMARLAGYGGVRLLSVGESITGIGPVPMERRAFDMVAAPAPQAAVIAPGEVQTGVNLALQFEMTR